MELVPYLIINVTTERRLHITDVYLFICDANCCPCVSVQVCVEVLGEYPFFVFGQGWSSCCPDRTTQLFELSCAKLCVGDVCVSLTLRGLRTGPLTDGQAFGTKLKTGHLSDSCNNGDPAGRNNIRPNAAGGPPMKGEQTSGTGSGLEQPPGHGLTPGSGEGNQGGALLTGAAKTDTSPLSKIQYGDPDRHTGRKRRWSAPERDQTDRAEGEPPPTSPKPSIIPQEVKISIEGHSSAGSQRCSSKESTAERA